MDIRILSLSGMTPCQRKIIRMSTSKHCFVSGHSGSGKTEMLLHRAAYLTETYNVAPESYRIFVFTDMAKKYVKPFLKFLGLPQKTTATLDQWCRLFHEHHISKDLSRTYINLRIDFPMIRERVLSVLKEQKELHNKLEFALVDDAQNVIHGPYNLRSLVPKVTTYHKAKGLAFDTVFLPRLVEDAFSNIKEEARLKMLYVGMTRARQWVYLSTVKGNEIREASILKAAKANGHLLIL